jgi:outer dense fiber protein 2
VDLFCDWLIWLAVGKVQFQLQQKLGELEPLPELLKNSEMRLQDTQERITVYERKCSEQTQLIADLTVKVESQSQQLESLREKYHSMMDENRSLAAQAETATRKTVETDQHNRELVSLAAKKEESLQRAMNRIEDLGHENASLKRQVDTALDETKRQRDDVKERAAMKERTSQARITDLEAQLARLSQSSSQLKRDKEETERRSKSKIYSLQDQLEQSQATNRNMENYVRFLKASYVNAYSDTSPLAASLR